MAVGLMCASAWAASDTATVSRVSVRRAAQKKVVLSPWEQAEQGRDALEATPEETRTRAEYTRTMDTYRAIYHVSPADVHAPAAVNAVAELLAEQGRVLHDAKSLKAAVGQYEFLRTQYPASSLGVQALLAEGEIEQNDLGDRGAAREKYSLLEKEHPKSEQAEEARAGLASLSEAASQRVSGSASQHTSGVAGPKENSGAGQRAGGASVAQASRTANQQISSTLVAPGSKASQGSSLPATAQTSLNHEMAAMDGAAAREARTSNQVSGQNAAPVVRSARNVAAVPDAELADVDAQTRPVGSDASGVRRSGGQALVTGIRHWSTATYTRVAIDLGDGVTYEAARVPNPDRIYFDLHDTRLAPELVGKSFTVTDDGFLKRVRAAQYSDGVTRVVLDVNDVTEYSAFLLPNPYRLIIDIHGTKAAPARVMAGAPQRRAEPAPTVPNTVALKSANASSEIAEVSDLPGRIDATSKPTSKPISAVVADGTLAGDRAPTVPTAASNGRGSGSGGAANDAARADAASTDAAGVANAASPTSSKKTRRARAKAADSTVSDATPARAATPMADGETSLVRALGLKIGRIVIDAGHGGHDSGTIGADGIEEKDVVLDVALRLGKLLHERLGADIIYTRSDDTFIPLETRTAIANKAQADLFISIHANSSQDESARGVETYYLNFTSDPTALDVAARENAVSDQSIHQLSDLVKKIALKDKIAESREFASDVEGSLYAGLTKGNAGLKDRGVKKAPFVVLIGANMPSILAEISFVTNPRDAEQLRDPDYRERVAESLYKGVAHYEAGLSGAKPAPTERASVAQ